jgi:hypothetical protein
MKVLIYFISVVLLAGCLDSKPKAATSRIPAARGVLDGLGPAEEAEPVIVESNGSEPPPEVQRYSGGGG